MCPTLCIVTSNKFNTKENRKTPIIHYYITAITKYTGMLTSLAALKNKGHCNTVRSKFTQFINGHTIALHLTSNKTSIHPEWLSVQFDLNRVLFWPWSTLWLDVLIHSSQSCEYSLIFVTQNGDGISNFLRVSYPPDQPSSSPACSWVCPGSLPFPPPLSAERSSHQFCHPAAFFPVGYNQHGLDQIIIITLCAKLVISTRIN